MDETVYLIGPRASGKTSVGRELSQKWSCPFCDADQVLSAALGTTISQYVQQQGWPAFRAKEKETLLAISEKFAGSGLTFVATGGGVVLDPENRALLRRTGFVIYLKVPEEILVQRLTRHPLASQRPSLTPYSVREEVRAVLDEREALYTGSAHLVVDGSGTLQDVVEAISLAVQRESCVRRA